MEDCLAADSICDLDLKTMGCDSYSGLRRCIRDRCPRLYCRRDRIVKTQLYNLLFPCKRRAHWFGDLTGYFPKPAELVIKITCRNMMFFTPAFVRKTTATAFLDQLYPLFITTPWMSFCHMCTQLLSLNLEWNSHRIQKN